MNLRIGICDDIEEYRLSLKELVAAYYNNRTQEVDFFLYASGEELVEAMQPLDLLFLDIEMPGIGGISAGTKYHDKFPHCKISLATAHGDRMPEALEVEPFNFLPKPFSAENVRSTLDKFNDKYLSGPSIEVFANRLSYTILQKEISLVRSFSGECEFIINGTSYRKEISLKKLLESLDSNLFFQIDRSTVINISHIREYKNETIVIGSQTYPISRRRKKEFEKLYHLFKFNA